MQALSPESDYKAPPSLKLDRPTWDAVFGSVGGRLRVLEAQRITLEETIAALESNALQTVTATITAEITARRADLTALEAEFKVVSDAYTQLVAGGVFADAIQLRTKPTNVPGPTLQKAIEQVAAGLLALSKKKTISVSSLYFGGF